jgi:hypothetical protein
MMNVRQLKKPAPAPISGEDEIAVLARRVDELDARDAAITRQILHLEKTTSSKIDRSGDVAAAEALLGGETFDARHSREPMTELAALHAEREVVRRALKIGRDRLHRLKEARAEEIWASYFNEIAAIEKKRVLLAIELQNVNRKRETLREKIIAAGGTGYLTTDGAELLGLGDRIDEVAWGVDRLIADGIATAAEVKQAKN